MRYSKQLFIGVFLILVGFLGAQELEVSKHVTQKINQLKQALILANKTSDTMLLAKNYIQLADFYKSLGLDSEAIKNYHTAQEFQLKNDSLFVYANNQIAAIHQNLKQFDEAKTYLNESVFLAEKINYKKGLATANAILGSVFEKLGDYNKALQYENNSLSIFKALKDSTGIALTNENIGSIYEDLEQYKLAQTFFEKANTFETDSLSDLKINILNNLGDVKRKQGFILEGLKFSEKALQLALKSGNISQEESALKDLARTYAELNDFETAYSYTTKQQQVSEQELKVHNANLVSAMQVLHNVKEAEAKVALLNQQNQVSKAKQTAIILVSLAVILVFLLWLIYLRKRKKQEQKLLKYKQKLLQADLDIKTAEEEALKREIDIKISALTNYSLKIAHKNKMLTDLSRTLTNLKSRNGEFVKSKLVDLSKAINSDLSNDNEWTELMDFFSQIHPNFFKNLKAQLQDETLTSSEFRLCMLLRLNLTSKAIASILNITPDSVRIARYRMRKKLPIAQKDDLQAYLINL
ncbi:hypothetical protein PK35_13125 [Tamlana nanhaiensis]|uniref:HTH luxR-type domain-containing protein n=1 Tax=Neotamlana nanhaiensis TaxID=1382798 RepID=A0A0D7W1G6_9FLAO|nr:tetratricopeptide repeat protein [Tamlana nanhaiensis]KJD31697.1 hypothetical protein PK35_13125 [Tamlana nanhaiensis]